MLLVSDVAQGAWGRNSCSLSISLFFLGHITSGIGICIPCEHELSTLVCSFKNMVVCFMSWYLLNPGNVVQNYMIYWQKKKKIYIYIFLDFFIYSTFLWMHFSRFKSGKYNSEQLGVCISAKDLAAWQSPSHDHQHRRASGPWPLPRPWERMFPHGPPVFFLGLCNIYVTLYEDL